MLRRHSLQPSRPRDSESLDITLYFVRRLVEAQSENLQLRREVNRSREHSHTLQRRLEACLTQIQDLVMSLREFVRLNRLVRATRAAADANGGLQHALPRFASQNDVDDGATDTTSSSARSTVSLSHSEDLEGSPRQLHYDTNVGRL